jgi:murein DD-endopeptidase MepM/ murein hydrolase activator NlpD
MYEGKMLSDIKTTMTRFNKTTNTLNRFKNLNYFGFLDSNTASSPGEANTDASQIVTDDNGNETSIEELASKPIEWYFDESNANEINNSIKYRRTLMNDTYDIGEVCETNLAFPIDSRKLIVTTGFKGNRFIENGQANANGISGVYVKGDGRTDTSQAIKSMFNGVVTQKKYSADYGNWIEIQSGKGLRVSYSFLDNIFVNAGDIVKQGQLIAAGSTNLNGDIYIEAIMDNEYVNPFRFLNKQAITAYNDWYLANPSDRGTGEMLEYKTVPEAQTSDIWDDGLLSGENIVDYTENDAETVNGVTKENNPWAEAD